MSAPPSVRIARDAEKTAVAVVLHDAFVDEDGLNYWLRQGATKDRARRRFFEAVVRDTLHPNRELWLAEADGQRLGGAIWLRPGDKAFDHTPLQQVLTLPLFYSIAGFDGIERARALGSRLSAHHPREPHAHLAFLGVATAAQGRGVGSALLKAALGPLDATNTIAYLEASKPRNVALYQRHGFEVTGEFELPRVRFWCMTRQPRG